MNGKWQGWAATAGILMVIVGGFKALSGVIGLFNDEWIVRGFNAYFFIDISALAWWYIIVGVILLFAGLAVLNGRAWGRWVGVFAGASPSSPSSSGSRSIPSGPSFSSPCTCS